MLRSSLCWGFALYCISFVGLHCIFLVLIHEVLADLFALVLSCSIRICVAVTMFWFALNVWQVVTDLLLQATHHLQSLKVPWYIFCNTYLIYINYLFVVLVCQLV